MDRQRLTALLAEHVRGWTKQERQVAGETVTVWIDPDAAGMQKQEYQEHELPDLAGTWTGTGIVVSKMKEKEFLFALEPDGHGFTVARFFIPGADVGSSRGLHNEIPTTAGYAALKALNVEVE